MSTSTIKSRQAGTNPRSEKVRAGTGNVFADLGLPDADARMAKAELAHEICALILSAKFTQAQAAQALGIDQPKVSALMHGRLKDFSTDRLLRFITLLGRDVNILIQTPQHQEHAAIRVSVQS